MTEWGPVDPPGTVDGSAPGTGRLEPVLRWLAGCQGSWPPHPPQAAHDVVVAPPLPGGSLAGGAAAADDLVDRGVDLLVVAATGDPTPGLVVCAALLDLDPVRAIGTAARDFTRLTVAVRDALRTARPHRASPAALLEHVDDAVAEAAGLLAQAAARRTPTVLDSSPLVAAAALVASRLAPGAPAWWLAGQAPVSPAAQAAHRDLRLSALLDLGVDGPAGATLAVTVLEQGIELARG